MIALSLVPALSFRAPPEDSETISRTVDLMSSRIRANLADASPVGKKVLGGPFKGCIGFRVWG